MNTFEVGLRRSEPDRTVHADQFTITKDYTTFTDSNGEVVAIFSSRAVSFVHKLEVED